MATFQHPGAHREALRLIQHALDTRATHLDLSDLRLRQLPKQLACLTEQLTSLNLSGCSVLINLSGIEQLTKLTNLNLSHCRSLQDLAGLNNLIHLSQLNLSGFSAKQNLTELEHMTQLTQLNLSDCRNIKNLNELARLTKLIKLDLSRCHALQSCAALRYLKQLKQLNLNHCIALQNLDVLKHMTQLEQLSLDNCNAVPSLDVLKYLTQLTQLSLAHNKTLHDLSVLKHLTQLTSLSLKGCISLQSLDMLKHLAQLTSLTLDDCSGLRNFDGLKHLTQLTMLSIVECGAQQCVDALEHLTQLTELNLSGCMFIQNLACLKHLTQLTKLDLSHCNTLQSLLGLEHMKQLTQLRLSNCKTLQNVEELKYMMKLSILSLDECCSLQNLDELKYLTQLSSLNLGNCGSPQIFDVMIHLTQLTELNLSGSTALQNLTCLKQMTQLAELNLSNCDSLQNLNGLECLAELTELYLYGCSALQNVAELSKLTQLESLFLGNQPLLTDLTVLMLCPKLRYFLVAGKLPTLSWELTYDLLFRFPRLQLDSFFSDNLTITHVPAELSTDFYQTALEDWWFECQQHGIETPKSLKVMLLGNGRIGKTQLARQLRLETYDETVPSTHGIQLHKFNMPGSDVELKSWDFGGQDVYLGTHTLFIDQRAVYLLLWHPDFENNEQVACEQLEMRNRPLSYWLAYLKSLAGDNANVLVCQSQCDSPECDRPAPIPHPPPFPTLRPLTISTKMEDGLAVFLPSFKRAVNQQLERNGEVWLPKSWLAVEHEIYSQSKDRKQIAFEEFEDICFEYGVAAPMTLANFLHQSGVLFYRSGHFDDHLILDQQWALQGVYLLLDRQHVLPQLKAGKGRFTLEMLKKWIVQHHLDSDDSDLFLEMMQQCGACFKVDETHYIAPDNLEELDVNDAQQVWQYAEGDSELELQYSFLHDATMRFLLSKIGEVAKAHAYYWRYGCCFYDSKHQVKVWFQCEVDVLEDGSLSNFSQPGKIIIRLAGSQSNRLAKHLLESITKTHHLGQLPEVSWLKGQPLEFRNEQQERKQADPFSDLGPATKPPVKQPTIYFSYAWGKEEEARQQASDQLYAKLKAEKFNAIRDKNSTELGSSIAEFERQIGAGDFALVILSKKYLYESAHCMKELAFLYECSQRQQGDFTKRVIPIVLQDANIDSPIERLKIVKHWQHKMNELQKLVDEVGPEAAGASSVDELQLMRAFINCTVNALTWLSDLVTERQQDLQVDATLELVKRRVEEYVQA